MPTRGQMTAAFLAVAMVAVLNRTDFGRQLLG
jgi:hypothetical protein